MKVVIGSKWEDPTIDKPYLRRLPPYWVLEETKKGWLETIALWIWRVIRG